MKVSMREMVRQLSDEELEKHAMISKDNKCKCGECFCCLCLAYYKTNKAYENAIVEEVEL